RREDAARPRSASHRPVPRARLRRNRFPGEPGRGYILALRVEDEPVAAHAVQVAEERLLVTREAEDPEGTGMPTLTPTIPPSVRRDLRLHESQIGRAHV